MFAGYSLAFEMLCKINWHTYQPPSKNLCCYCCCVASVVSDSVRPHRRQPTRLPRPWGSPGKNTGVGCHFLLQCMKVKSESGVAQSCPPLRDPMDCSPPGSSIHGIFQARVPLPSPENLQMIAKRMGRKKFRSFWVLQNPGQ